MESPLQISIIVAVAENGVIGSKGDMPWKMSSDLKNFRNLTFGKPLIMGRRTFDSLKGPLDGRDNIVVTSNPEYRPEGVFVAHDFETALNIAYTYARERNVEEVMVIGGAKIYESALPRANRIYLTKIHGTPEGDTYFPEIDWSDWREVMNKKHEAGPRDEFDFSFIVYDRITAG